MRSLDESFKIADQLIATGLFISLGDSKCCMLMNDFNLEYCSALNAWARHDENSYVKFEDAFDELPIEVKFKLSFYLEFFTQ